MAVETATILLEGTNLPVIYDNRLIERFFGDFEKKKIDKEIDHKLWDQNEIYEDSNIETIIDCLNRTKSF